MSWLPVMPTASIMANSCFCSRIIVMMELKKIQDADESQDEAEGAAYHHEGGEKGVKLIQVRLPGNVFQIRVQIQSKILQRVCDGRHRFIRYVQHGDHGGIADVGGIIRFRNQHGGSEETVGLSGEGVSQFTQSHDLIRFFGSVREGIRNRIAGMARRSLFS